MTDIINKLQAFADANPQSIAVRHTTDELTYQQLMDESSKLAHRLQGSKKPMILFGHMSPYMIVGMIGAIKAGCGYVPVDTSIPEDRIKMIINKVQPEFVFNTTDESFESLEGEVFTIEDIKTSQDPVIFDSQIKDNDTVYTIFTSGSTGEPKGVQIEYASLVQFTEWMLELNKSGNKQQWLNQAPFSFDLSVMAIYPCLASGGTLNLVDKNMINKPKLLNEMLTATPINIWVSTPSFMEMCLLLPTLNEEQYGSLNEFFFCGEILPHRAAKALVSRFPSATIYNTYGPTEATVAVTSIQITQEILDQYPTLPVGVERLGARLSTTDDGELVIEGQSVSLGYLKMTKKQLKYLISMTVFVHITLVIKRSLKMVNGSFKVVLISKSN
ncbi:D-alanine--poly(phosphoribitol) ligase subunit 1 [Staphylococcus aureus]|nr:D-alanine--poly(phosphoribitol) ligase subunit 1 [Staphylococcus aureus]